MKLKLFLFSLIVFFLGGCMTLGTKINYAEVPNLKLGKVNKSDHIETFGKPERVVKEVNDNGSFEIAVYYQMATDFWGNNSTRYLYLEFRDNTLNGYDYVSSFKDDSTMVKLDQAAKIKTRESKMSEVLSILGDPTGKVLCPTILYNIKDKCEDGGQIWAWRQQDKGSAFNFTPDRKEIFIIFAPNSTVSEVNIIEETS